MSANLNVSRLLPALATAFLLSVSLPALPALAKEKTKGGAAATTTTSQPLEMDYAISIPTIDAVQSSIPDDVLNDILNGNIADHAQALADFDATSVTVPEIQITVSAKNDSEDHEAVITFTDLKLEDVADGIAGRVSLGGTSMDTDEGTFDFGAMSASSLNIAGMLGFYGLVDTGQTGFETIYADFSAEGGSLTTDEIDCTIGAMSAAEFKARPLKTPFGDLILMAQKVEGDPEMMDPALMGQFMRMYADVLTAFETSEASIDGMSCTGEEDGKPMTFEMAGMTMGPMTPGVYPSISMDGFSINVEGDGAFTFDNVTVKPADLTSTIATLESAPDTVDDAWFEANARSLFPAMEGLTITGMDFDIPDPEDDDARIQFSVGSFDITLGNYRNAIPTDIDVVATNIKSAIPEGTGDEFFQQLLSLGVTEVDAGFRMAAAWDEQANTIALEEFSLTGVDLATMTLVGTVTNATAQLFSTDENEALMAGMGLAVKDLNVSVVDAGLTDIVISAIAAEQGADAATMRPVFADLAKGTIIGMLAGVADAAKLGDAVNAFVAGRAKTLDIGIKAKTEPGLGMADFMEAETNPASLLGKVDISAEAK